MTISRIDQAGPGEQRELLEAAWEEIHHGGDAPEGAWDTCRKCLAFKRKLDAEAYLDAAMMLLPSKAFVIDCATQTTQYMQPVAHVWTDKGKFTGKARAHALALLAAIIRAGGKE